MAIPTYTREQLIALLSTKLADQSTITAVEHRELETAIVNAIYGQIGDIKEISCNTTYITNNFKTGTGSPDEGLGLPSGERYGWAICNGKNGTVDKRGNVSIGYDSVSYPTLASTQSGGALTPYRQGGSRNAVLIAHTHESGSYNTGSGLRYLLPLVTPNPTQIFTSVGLAGGSDVLWRYTKATGVNNELQNSPTETGLNANMQPYIVTLFIQRIPV
jgi:hypothetical protein